MAEHVYLGYFPSAHKKDNKGMSINSQGQRTGKEKRRASKHCQNFRIARIWKQPMCTLMDECDTHTCTHAHARTHYGTLLSHNKEGNPGIHDMYEI